MKATLEDKAQKYAEKSNKAVGFPNVDITHPVKLGFISGSNNMKIQAIEAFELYLSNYCGLDVTDKRYNELLTVFKNNLG